MRPRRRPGHPLPRKLTGLLREPLRARAAERAEAAQLSNLTIRQRLSHELDARKDQIPAILDALYAKAKRGDVPAARELRGWFDQGLGKAEGVSLSEGDTTEGKAIEDMTPGERAVLRARVVREIARLEAEEASKSAATDEPV